MPPICGVYPSLKGSSLEKAGHPSQKPREVIRDASLRSSSSIGDMVIRSVPEARGPRARG